MTADQNQRTQPGRQQPDSDGLAVLAEILRGIAPEIDLVDIAPDSELQADLDLDSMDFLNIITALADRTGVIVPERDYAQVATVRAFADYVAAARSTM